MHTTKSACAKLVRSPYTILAAASLVTLSFGCSSTPDEQIVMLPTAGSGSMQPGAGTGGMVAGVAGSGVTTGGGGAGSIAGGSTGGASGGDSGGAPPSGGGGGAGGSGMGGSGMGGSSSGSGGGGGGAPEEKKIVLFDGTPATFAAWKSVRNGGANPWKNNGNGTMTVATGTGDIISTQPLQNAKIHVEYMSPKWVGNPANDQERGNSGVYVKGSYEVQILNTFGMPPAADRCGAIYSVSAPLVVACRDAEEWNTYEIDFRAPTCNGNQKTANARFVEVKLNGTVVQRNVDVSNTTIGGQNETCEPRGILLQDHSTIVPVTFRNIWATPLD